MDIYLPIANMSVNALVVVLLGGGVGIGVEAYDLLRRLAVGILDIQTSAFGQQRGHCHSKA